MESNKKIVIVTGGGAGIGKACAQRFSKEGFGVVIGDLSEADGKETADLIEKAGGKIIFLHGDIADDSFCRLLAETALDKWGRIDVLIGNAAARNFTKIIDATEEEWNRLLAVNLRGTAQCCQAVLPTMIEQQSGVIVLLSSEIHRTGRTEMPIYDVTKAGIISMTRTLALEHAKDNIRVNAICPGYVVTDYHIRKAELQGRDPNELYTAKSGVFNRSGSPAEIAGPIHFLASDEASFISGQTLTVG
ncbi:MAG: SDR family oxidoreductase [SAR324 cluster bacterium]|nr:SDR family oxidoreductase [SAR324 cluster bacterium]